MSFSGFSDHGLGSGPGNQTPSRDKVPARQCQRCGHLGHWTEDCPTRIIPEPKEPETKPIQFTFNFVTKKVFTVLV